MSNTTVYRTASKGFTVTYELEDQCIREIRKPRIGSPKVKEENLSELASKFHRSKRFNLDIGIIYSLVSLGALVSAGYLAAKFELEGWAFRGALFGTFAVLLLPLLFRRKFTEVLVEHRERKSPFQIVTYEENLQGFDDFLEEVRIRIGVAQKTYANNSLERTPEGSSQL